MKKSLLALAALTAFAGAASAQSSVTLFGIVDATLAWGDRSEHPLVLYTAAAEGSPDSRRDGEVAGSAIGCLDPRGDATVLRYALLRDADDGLLPLKVEGIACGRADDRQVYVVLDVDDPDAPSMLCELRLEGPWPVPNAPV